jgi:acetyl-CoA decarbonylase/synthase complex subunit gamma
MLVTENPAEMKAALDAVADKKPLLCGATAENVDAMAALAKEKGCPLVIRADGLPALAELSEKATAAGAADLILDSGARNLATGLAHQTAIRRAALKKFRAFGFPTIAFPAGDDPLLEALDAVGYVAKYAGVVVLSGTEPWELLPILTARQNIYTDPQKPIQLAAGIYEVGAPDADSPVMVTTNFSLTYFTVEGDVEASKVPSWIVVVDTEGTSVLTAWAAEKFTADSIAQAVKKFELESKVKHRKLIIPGHVAVLSGKLEEASGWNVLVGPRESSGIPTYLRTSWQKAA